MRWCKGNFPRTRAEISETIIAAAETKEPGWKAGFFQLFAVATSLSRAAYSLVLYARRGLVLQLLAASRKGKQKSQKRLWHLGLSDPHNQR